MKITIIVLCTPNLKLSCKKYFYGIDNWIDESDFDELIGDPLHHSTPNKLENFNKKTPLMSFYQKCPKSILRNANFKITPIKKIYCHFISTLKK